MKIDSFCHLLPPRYADRFFAIDDSAPLKNLQERTRNIPALFDLDLRFRQMDEFGAYRQVINVAAPPLEDMGSSAFNAEMARLANDSLAELVADHPDRFVGFCAAVSLDDPQRAIEEAEYAFTELGAVGVQIYSHVHGKPLDLPEFDAFWETIARHDKLVQVHPNRTSAWPDYPTETRSRFEIWWALGWEYDLSAFCARIVFSGILERWPNLKFLIHHGGAMIPHFAGRIGPGWDQLGARTPQSQREDVELPHPLTRRPMDYFKMFYADTATFGAADPLWTSLRFFGVDRTLFASDSPYDPEKGPGFIRSTIAAIESFESLTGDEKESIYHRNATRLFGFDASTQSAS
ncbi:amidohydrolase family protein [Microbacterium pseudoresistens]|uniref:Aminocarboxymuconate-semialdehyde decarboxylase n=1 Tax=Microbacterium pseudoresistens TaxID=640634 RepID=A0A7Y9EVU8_9MICO|nr:amidohydrolase family protein [Microbacterium pseudoresistens]NYD54900.1 aminocarboxymuconate-semialdehyde decarboxylase [Microbacterium pseudoresistens]